MTERTTRLRGVVRLGCVGVLAAVVAAGGGASTSHGASAVYTWPGAKMLTVEINPPGAGWVRSTPYLIDCPAECVRPWDTGAIVQLQVGGVTRGYTFTGWSGDIAVVCPGTSTCGVTMDADRRVVANFTGRFTP